MDISDETQIACVKHVCEVLYKRLKISVIINIFVIKNYYRTIP